MPGVWDLGGERREICVRTLRFSGPVARPEETAVEPALAQSTNVAELLERLGYAKAHQPFLQVFVSGRRLRLSSELPREGEFTILLPMGGG